MCTQTLPLLQILAEERQTHHCKRWNNGKEPQLFQVGDVAKAHVQFQSKSDTR